MRSPSSTNVTSPDFDQKFRSLLSYFEQIERVRALELSCILPGHGLPFVGHEPVIDSLLRFYNTRQAKILDALRAGGATNVSDLSNRIFPNAAGMQQFLAVCELLGNLEVMEHRGILRREFDGRHYRFLPTD